LYHKNLDSERRKFSVQSAEAVCREPINNAETFPAIGFLRKFRGEELAD
jgi:hypothetical protein